MVKFENTEVMGWEHAIRGMRNPLNSWQKSDSYWKCTDYSSENERDIYEYKIGSNDYDLMKRLRNAGTDHRKFMRMITVYVDITAPLYFWKEFDTYKVGTVANSCSTMHCIHKKEFTSLDFSDGHLSADRPKNLFVGLHDENDDDILYDTACSSQELLGHIIIHLNYYRKKYLETKDKKYWWQMIQLLPSSYNQKRTVMLNYEVLANIYKSRTGHKLDEWSIGFIDWIKSLPYSELITGEFGD